MTTAKEDYLSKRGKQIQQRKRIVTYISLVAFGGSMLFAGVNTVKQAWETPQTKVVESAQVALKQEVEGYELVLQREPENQLALEKLSLLRMRSQDTKGAKVLVEKLVKLHPNRQDYKVVLEQIQKQEMSEKQ
ncbi:tetratricopeptide repeat protein [Cronbergia sp. UHCC 0137]|uniref:tetratricopeptide repeat protein n=1 Tax=Cronbergia sp. UHCC 0137 TaxID=3110239 RepID=UPI002B1F9ACC|nr:tetratricopeptide repeat protein [Cronbergia sp. UHCC 0137]MEA5616568.1 tetratricopeptide repeat protein [Cronbergia sp. UHCC 0137]